MPWRSGCCHKQRRHRPRHHGLRRSWYGTAPETFPTSLSVTLVWGIDPGHDRRHWYFVVCSIDAKGELRIDQFKIARDDRDLAKQTRAELMLEMIQRRPPSVIMDFDDELLLARWCEALCPGERSRRIRSAIERERAEKTGN